MFLARKLLLLAALATFCLTAHATSTLAFDGGGYTLELEIGDSNRPEVASVTFHKPGDAQGVVLRGNFRVAAFDTRRQELVLIYTGADGRVAPFTLRVQGNRATLELAGTRIQAGFDWSM